MSITFSLIAQALAFILFIAFTMKFVWPPMLRAIEARQKQIADGLAAAEQGLALALKACLERVGQRADAGDDRNPERDTGDENVEAGQAVALFAPSQPDGERRAA